MIFLNHIYYIRAGGFEFGFNNPLSNSNLTLFSQDIEDLLTALRLSGLLQQNISDQIMNFENLTRIQGTFDNVKVRRFLVFLNVFSIWY